MPSLDDLRKRIKSVKSTQKITKAMKMVAAAKLRKAQENAEKGRPYSEKMNNIILNLSNSITEKENAPKLLVGTDNEKVHLCIVLTADRGLCGGFNTNIVKKAKYHTIELNTSPKNMFHNTPQNNPKTLQNTRKHLQITKNTPKYYKMPKIPTNTTNTQHCHSNIHQRPQISTKWHKRQQKTTN